VGGMAEINVSKQMVLKVLRDHLQPGFGRTAQTIDVSQFIELGSLSQIFSVASLVSVTF
jgi:hypothetical protein